VLKERLKSKAWEGPAVMVKSVQKVELRRRNWQLIARSKHRSMKKPRTVPAPFRLG
jgi:hypothetical protein